MPAQDFKKLEKESYKIRQLILSMIFKAQSGHPAGSLGMTDVFTALYFGKVLRHDPKKPNWDKRDYFLLSNGHICPGLYATLAQRGFFPKEELKTFRQINSRLQGHTHFEINSKYNLPGIENTSGPLGQGYSQASGVAYALKMDNKKNKVFCMMSDGEQQEGQIWEAYQFVIHHQLNNLIGIIDYNNIQISGNLDQVLSLGNLKLKLISFGFKVFEIDAHNFKEIIETLDKAKETKKQPVIVLAKNTPGKGVSFMENDYHWHGKAPNEKEFNQAIRELKIKEKNI